MEVVSSGPVSSRVTRRFSHVLNGYLGNGLPVAPHDKARRRKATNDTIGVDISKASLDVWRLSDRKHMRFSNDVPGLKALCKWLGTVPVRVVYEATGRFHRDLEVAVSKARHGPVKVNPSRARRFAQATGKIAKTDRVDAQMLAHMGSTLALEPTPVRSKSMREISELHVARVALIKDRTACRNRLDTARNRIVITQLRARERQIGRQISQIDAELVRLIKADPEFARRYEILMSIRGIGPVAATAMIVDMPELGTMTPKEAASLAGEATVTRQPGS